MKKKTQTEKLAEQNAKAIRRMREASKEDAELHERVRRGELTAGQALQEKGKKPQKPNTLNIRLQAQHQ